jgi:hypothetical protein
MSTPWTQTTKNLNPGRQPERPSVAVSGSFTPPKIGLMKVAPNDLFKSIARCAAASRASPSLVAAVVASSRALCEFLVDDATPVFAITDDVFDLADAERTALSGRIGAGMADQMMETLGSAWRDIAEQLILSSGPLADFVYQEKLGRSIVLTEAKGSISNKASSTAARTRAGNAYRRQVDPYVFTSPSAPNGHAPIGLIEHGYVVAFAARPGPGSSSPPANGADAFVVVAETDSTSAAAGSTSSPSGAAAAGGSGGSPPTGPTAGTIASPDPLIALGNYRGVFLLRTHQVW